MKLGAILAVILFLQFCVSENANAEESASTTLSLDSYKCKEFVSDAAHPNEAAKLLRAMMMVSWATGFAAAHNVSDVRSDKAALAVMGDVIGRICLANPDKLAVSTVVSEIKKISDKQK